MPQDDPGAVIVAVGDELLLGETVDTNSAWLGRWLAERGLDVVRRYTVADRAEEIRAAVSGALDAAELVLVSGGLGPTADDVTRDAVAGLLDAPLERDEALLESLRRRFREHGWAELPPRNVSQAMVPRGARVLPNGKGTAPGLALEAGGRWVVLLPGVPAELKDIAAGPLSDLLEDVFGGRLRPLHHRVLHTTGIPESKLAGEVDDVWEAAPREVSLAFLPDVRGVDLRLTVRGVGDPERARGLLDRAEAVLEPVVGPHRVAAAGGDLVEVVERLLVERKWTVAVAESCTGGLVAKRLTDRAGASAWFRGGVVAYADAVKTGTLGVPEEALRRHGAVSEAVARAMAEGAASRLGADCALSLTGVAGPGGGSEEKPVGTVWYAATAAGRTEARVRRFPGDRSAVRERSGQAALLLLVRLLEGLEPGETGT